MSAALHARYNATEAGTCVALPTQAASRGDGDSPGGARPNEDTEREIPPVSERRPRVPDPEFEHALRLQMAVITGE